MKQIFMASSGRSWTSRNRAVYRVQKAQPDNCSAEDKLSNQSENGPIFLNRHITLPMAYEDTDCSKLVNRDIEMDVLYDGAHNNGFMDSDCGSNVYTPDSVTSNESGTNKTNPIQNDSNFSDTSPLNVYDDVDGVTFRMSPGRNKVRPISTESSESISSRRNTSKHWDVFRTLPKNKDITIDEAYVTLFRKLVKVIVSVFLTVFILISALLSKGCLFLVTSNIYTNVTLYCIQPNNNTFTTCRRVPPDRHEKVVYRLSQSIQIRWIWALFLIIITPYVFTFVRTLWRVCFKKTRQPTVKVLFMVLTIEALHSVGICIFAFVFLPAADPIRGLVMMFGVAILPSILKIFDADSKGRKSFYIYLADVLAFLVQLSILIFWPVLYIFEKKDRNSNEMWTIPVSLFLISLGWWENFVNRYSFIGKIAPKLRELKRNIRRMRTKVYMVVSVWKIAMTICLMTIITSNGVFYCVKTLYFNGNDDALKCPYLTDPMDVRNVESKTYKADPFWVVFIQILSSLLCYYFAKSACKILLQVVSFCLPLVLTAPVGLGLLVETCESWKHNITHPLMPSYLYWTCDVGGINYDYMAILIRDYYLPVAFLWWLSFMWITFHVWFPGVERLAQTEKLFVKPLYCGLLLEQAILLNRRRDDRDKEFKNADKTNYGIEINSVEVPPDPTYSAIMASQSKKKDTTPMIYACSTMWHETEKEMIQVMTSIFRLDVDQCARRNAQKYFDIVDPDYYEFEANIFFDDAYEAHDANDQAYSVNSFVRQLVRVVNIAARKVHKVQLQDLIADKYTTPYGGRLEWNLPGGNKLVAHLKDKMKIRHKKRWSQVMYMYYLLGHRLVALPIDAKRKQTIADNTFILTLDGDVDFQPAAVQLLLDRMNKNEKVAAACGRIHPIGTGPMVWYQKFEYAVSHWLQKATEHMIGCVLCSPGCFSLFRASSLMDDNVMNKYAAVSNKARHFVQYDQGEDRWLCTLLLQQGYRVEYCAAADALTYAPEGFNEFYNQRRRWSPSTMANILDLLNDWRNVMNVNENISGLYIVYQLLLFVSSLVTPGTIFLLIVGAISAAFPEIDLVKSLIANLVPVGGFVVICLMTKTRWQLTVAGVMSVIYAIVMMVVLVGLCLQTSREGLCSPTTIFLMFVVGAFIVSGLLHPQEIVCLLHGALYFLAIPSMSMLLMIYSICNVHVVSWGTRETQQKSEVTNPKMEQTGRFGKFVNSLKVGNTGEDSSYAFSFGNLFKCICCPTPTTDAGNTRLETILNKLEAIERQIGGSNSQSDGKSDEGSHDPINLSKKPDVNGTDSQVQTIQENSREDTSSLMVNRESGHFQETQSWICDSDLGTGEIRYLRSEETDFWKGLIEQYLYPLDNDLKHQAKLQSDLVELRNRASLFFFVLNALFIVVIFSLQYVNENTDGHGLSIPLPCHARNGSRLTLEPISLLFMSIFGIALLIQFLSMFFHRLSTFTHILSSAEVNCLKPNKAEIHSTDISSKVQLAKDLGSFKQDQDDDSKSTTSVSTMDDTLAEVSSISTDDSPKVARKRMVYRLSKKRRHKKEHNGNLNARFEEAFLALAHDLKTQRRNEAECGPDEEYFRQRMNSCKKRKGFNKKSSKAIADIEQNKSEAFFKKAETIKSRWQNAAAKVLETKPYKSDSWSNLIRGLVGQSKTNLNTINEESRRRRVPRLKNKSGVSPLSIQKHTNPQNGSMVNFNNVQVHSTSNGITLEVTDNMNGFPDHKDEEQHKTTDVMNSDSDDSEKECFASHVYDTVNGVRACKQTNESTEEFAASSQNNETGESKSIYSVIDVDHIAETES